MNTVLLICLPYAGGSSSIYGKWQWLLPDFIKPLPIELPGRGRRAGQPLVTSFEELARDVYGQIAPVIAREPYALFGYSMGSWLIYEIYRMISANNGNKPIHVFLAAKEPVHRDDKQTNWHVLPPEDFIQRLKESGGIPEEICQSNELMELYLPIIQADFRAIETYKPVLDGTMFDCPVTALTGSDDEISEHDVREWQRYCSKEFKCYVFRGGHFFIRDRAKGIIQLIKNQLIICFVKKNIQP